MSSMYRHKLNWKEYQRGLDALSGEGELSTGAGILSELAKGGAGMIEAEQAKKAAAAKAAADKEARKDVDEAINKAKAARQNAIGKAAEAKAADMKARTESDQNGPLHKKAKLAADTAVHYDADAVALEMKAAALAESRGIPLPPGFGPSMSTPEQQAQLMKMQHGGKIDWVPIAVGGAAVVGGGGLLYLIYRLFKKK